MSSDRYLKQSMVLIRIKLGMNQTELAEELGISTSMVSLIESSKREYPKDIFKKLYNLCLKRGIDLQHMEDIRQILAKRYNVIYMQGLSEERKNLLLSLIRETDVSINDHKDTTRNHQ